jgi:hypothetical protein
VRIAAEKAYFSELSQRGKAFQRLASRVWGALLSTTCRYGYEPSRSIVWLVSYWVAASLGLMLFWHQFTYTEKTDPFFFLIDRLMPFVDFPQNANVLATGWEAWAVLAITVVGWVLATAAVAGIGRAFNRRA